jgi:cytochrome c
MKRFCLTAAILLALAGCQSKGAHNTAPTVGASSSSVTQSALPVAPATTAGDATKGKLISEKCAACHYFNSTSKVGPGLGGVFGRQAGSMPGYDYEFANYIQPGKAWRWDKAHLAAWMCDSSEAVTAFTGDASARTRMPPQHVCDPADQADLIAFLKTL